MLLDIEQHLDEELSLEALSEVAHFSRFHFHRAFSASVGVSVARYVQLMRLRRASQMIRAVTREEAEHSSGLRIEGWIRCLRAADRNGQRRGLRCRLRGDRASRPRTPPPPQVHTLQEPPP